MVSLSHRSTHISRMMQRFHSLFSHAYFKWKARTNVTPGHQPDQGTRPRGVSEPNVWLYSLSWITIQELGAEGGVQRDNPLCTPTQPLIVHIVLGWIHRHSFTFINTMFTTIPTHSSTTSTTLYYLSMQ